jgi:predicted HicB family RNase H-like nuclease
MPGDLWTQDDKNKLTGKWNRGEAIKQIAHDLGKSVSGVKNMRRTLGLPARRTGDKEFQLRINVNKDVHDEMGKRAMDRRQSVSDYVRMLVIRDIGHSR